MNNDTSKSKGALRALLKFAKSCANEAGKLLAIFLLFSVIGFALGVGLIKAGALSHLFHDKAIVLLTIDKPESTQKAGTQTVREQSVEDRCYVDRFNKMICPSSDTL